MDRKHYEPEHEAFGEAFRAFADKSIVPDYLEWERAGIMPREVFHEAGKGGFLGTAVPEQYGGGGIEDFRFNQALDEQIAYAGIGGAGLGMSLHNDICLPYFLAFTTDEQKAALAAGHLLGRVDHCRRDDRAGRGVGPLRHPNHRQARRRALRRQRLEDLYHQRHQRRPRHSGGPHGRAQAQRASRC